MRMLIAAATTAEVGPLAETLGAGRQLQPRLVEHAYRGHVLHVLTTGVGMVATAAWCSRALAGARYDAALNIGVCGSFDPALAVGAVVHVVKDRIAELGAEDGARWIPIEELGLLDKDDAAELVNEAPPRNVALVRLPAVKGITVNTVHGNDAAIAAVRRRFQPQVETMEGAAFMYTCLTHGVTFAQIRAVSNVIERRNRCAWKIAEAIDAVTAAAVDIIDAS